MKCPFYSSFQCGKQKLAPVAENPSNFTLTHASFCFLITLMESPKHVLSSYILQFGRLLLGGSDAENIGVVSYRYKNKGSCPNWESAHPNGISYADGFRY